MRTQEGKRGRGRDRDAQGRLVGHFDRIIRIRDIERFMPQGSFPNRPVRAFAAATAVFALTATAISPPPTCRRLDPPDAWKLSVAVGPAFALGKAADRWAKLIAERSAGKLPVRLFPGATLSLRDPAREFIALRDGAADLAGRLDALLVGAGRRAQPDRAAVARARRRQHRRRSRAGPVGAELSQMPSSARGAVPLALAALGHRALATSASPPRSPDEVNGMKVRCVRRRSSSIFSSTWAPCRDRCAASDAQAAFRAGTLDAQEGTLSDDRRGAARGRSA